MSVLIVIRCDVCGHTGRYKTRPMAEYHFPRHSCDIRLANAAAAQAAIAREAQVDRTPQPCLHRTKHEHGTYVAYTLDRCRCLPCVAAMSEYNANLARRHAYGQSPYVDADPVREHIARLRRAGIGLKTLAKAAGVSHGALSQLVYGRPRPDGTRRPPSKRVRATTAARVLATPLDATAPSATVDSTGARRRLEALATLGWSVARLANRAGVDRQCLDGVLSGRPAKAATVRAIRDLYDELWDTPAPTTTKTDKIAASRARRRAEQSGYAPPLAWDEDTLDDPHAVPQVGDAPARGVDLDEWLHLVRGGEGLERAARRLGVTLGGIERSAERHNRPDVIAPIVADRAERALARTHVIPTPPRR